MWTRKFDKQLVGSLCSCDTPSAFLRSLLSISRPLRHVQKHLGFAPVHCISPMWLFPFASYRPHVLDLAPGVNERFDVDLKAG